MTFVWPVLFAVALLAGMWITERRSNDRALARRTYLLGVCGGIVGARFWFSAQYGVWSSGMSFWGFVVGATVVVALYRRQRSGRWKIGDFADATAPALLLGVALIRVGCFTHGCCYGRLSDLPWAVSYGPSTPAFDAHLRAGLISPFATTSLPVQPTQLYEALFHASLLVAIVLARRLLQRLPRHCLFLLTVASCAAFRFFVEFLRGDSGGRSFGPLTFAQASSLAVVLGTVYLIRGRMPVVRKPVTRIESEARS